MSRKYNAKIKLYYPIYSGLVEKEKEIAEKVIVLLPKQGHHWKENKVNIIHDSDDEIEFCASKKNGDHKYGLKLFMKDFNAEPVYYFDSDGPAHYTTNSSNIRLARIDTPHINYYDENGRKQAIQTDYIKENQEKLEKDINFGMSYFCVEANINSEQDVPVIGQYEQTEIMNKEKSDFIDVHANIDFPHGE